MFTSVMFTSRLIPIADGQITQCIDFLALYRPPRRERKKKKKKKKKQLSCTYHIIEFLFDPLQHHHQVERVPAHYHYILVSPHEKLVIHQTPHPSPSRPQDQRTAAATTEKNPRVVDQGTRMRQTTIRNLLSGDKLKGIHLKQVRK